MKKLMAIVFIFVFTMIILLPTIIVVILKLCNFDSYNLSIYNNKTKRVMNLKLEEYLKGVVAAEMPADFQIEALKAQAIAARTYTLKKVRNKRLSTNSNVDQAWLSKEELKKKWGRDKYNIYWPKVSAAVNETKGLVLCYKGDLVEAVYHAASGDCTEDSLAVWGNSIPYLSSVSSKYEKSSPYYRTEKEYFKVEICRVFNIKQGDFNIKIMERSSSGRVLRLRVGKKFISGREFREKMKLPSTNFFIKEKKYSIVIIASGYGHGVGMSQYGANGMAQASYNYKDILKHYYPGSQITDIW